MTTNTWWASALGAIVSAEPALCGITVVTGAQSANQWFSGVSAYTSIAFTEFPASTLITEQYASLGVHFGGGPQGNEIMFSGGDSSFFPQDNLGLLGASTVEMVFDTPMRAWGAYYPGLLRARLYTGTQLVHSWDPEVGGWVNNFIGFFGDISFDRVVLLQPFSEYPGPDNTRVAMDNMYFSTVPAPSAATCLMVFLAMHGRRRKANSR